MSHAWEVIKKDGVRIVELINEGSDRIEEICQASLYLLERSKQLTEIVRHTKINAIEGTADARRVGGNANHAHSLLMVEVANVISMTGTTSKDISAEVVHYGQRLERIASTLNTLSLPTPSEAADRLEKFQEKLQTSFKLLAETRKHADELARQINGLQEITDQLEEGTPHMRIQKKVAFH